MARLNEIFDYQDKTTTNNVLKNKLNIKDPIELEHQERLITSKKLSELYISPEACLASLYKDPENHSKLKFDVEHYLNIHKYLLSLC